MDETSGSVMKALYDSGAGVNMGRRKYHEAVKSMFPPLIASFIDFAKSEYDALAIGGIDGQVWGPDITACITYRLPHTVQGMPATITIGLADECITNTLVGIPFMTRARLIYDAAEQVVHAGVFGTTWRVTMERPTKSDGPPARAGGSDGAAVLITQDGCVARLE